VSATTSSDHITSHLRALAANGRRALIPYLTAGYPTPEEFIELMRGAAAAGADVIEVGVPFSDPMADGPVIQASSQVALRAGVTLERTLELIREAAVPVPVVLFSYLNPVLSSGPDVLERAASAGVHGLLITDLPLGADPELERRLASGSLALVRLVAPTTPAERMADIDRHGGGFIYLISRLGVTGTRDSLPADLPETIARLRSVSSLPVCVGFGISTPEQAGAVARMADGVIVGSAIVRAAGAGIDKAIELVAALRAGMDSATAEL
jgi:tryptophan synthase alpha chain